MKYIVLTSPSKSPCGVEAFARQLSRTLEVLPDQQSVEIPIGGGNRDAARIWDGLQHADIIILNLPVVAWKRNLLLPLVALLMAKLRGAGTVAVLHEWSDLNWLRRLSYFFYLTLADTVICSSPVVKNEFTASPGAKLFPAKLGLVPIPPNLRRRQLLAETALSRQLAKIHAEGRLIIGHFGSIYPRKQSIVILDLVAGLRARGIDAFLVFIGSFIKGSDTIEQDFRARIHALALDDHVVISGYVRDDAEIFGLFDQVDAFAYQFAEGLTSRRGSVLATLQSGKPVFVNAPDNTDEFDHHPSYRALLSSGTLQLLPHDASIEDFVDAIAKRDFSAAGTVDVDFDAAWKDAALAVIDAVSTAPQHQEMQQKPWPGE